MVNIYLLLLSVWSVNPLWLIKNIILHMVGRKPSISTVLGHAQVRGMKPSISTVLGHAKVRGMKPSVSTVLGHA